ncbi:hypothetical protein Anapl_03794 [Anas platyrhynchos]|uniref:Uncharacterized protein n=1 Tax=Anas platyrhynchos TaxID=8839 RepID=R0LQ19_ANAPL|nr:hypothetical protein Anapl_03794 [Anas platyrhynchos]
MAAEISWEAPAASAEVRPPNVQQSRLRPKVSELLAQGFRSSPTTNRLYQGMTVDILMLKWQARGTSLCPFNSLAQQQEPQDSGGARADERGCLHPPCFGTGLCGVAQGRAPLGHSEAFGHCNKKKDVTDRDVPKQLLHLLCVVGPGEQLVVPQQLLLLATSMPHWCCWLRRRTSSQGFAGVCREARTAVMPPPWLREAAAGFRSGQKTAGFVCLTEVSIHLRMPTTTSWLASAKQAEEQEAKRVHKTETRLESTTQKQAGRCLGPTHFFRAAFQAAAPLVFSRSTSSSSQQHQQTAPLKLCCWYTLIPHAAAARTSALLGHSWKLTHQLRDRGHANGQQQGCREEPLKWLTLHLQAERLVAVLIHSKIPELLMAAGLGQLLNWPSLQQQELDTEVPYARLQTPAKALRHSAATGEPATTLAVSRALKKLAGLALPLLRCEHVFRLPAGFKGSSSSLVITASCRESEVLLPQAPRQRAQNTTLKQQLQEARGWQQPSSTPALGGGHCDHSSGWFLWESSAPQQHPPPSQLYPTAFFMKRNYSYHYTRYIQVNRKRQKSCYQVPWEGRRMAIGSFGSYVNGARCVKVVKLRSLAKDDTTLLNLLALHSHEFFTVTIQPDICLSLSKPLGSCDREEVTGQNSRRNVESPKRPSQNLCHCGVISRQALPVVDSSSNIWIGTQYHAETKINYIATWKATIALCCPPCQRALKGDTGSHLISPCQGRNARKTQLPASAPDEPTQESGLQISEGHRGCRVGELDTHPRKNGLYHFDCSCTARFNPELETLSMENLACAEVLKCSILSEVPSGNC